MTEKQEMIETVKSIKYFIKDKEGYFIKNYEEYNINNNKKLRKNLKSGNSILFMIDENDDMSRVNNKLMNKNKIKLILINNTFGNIYKRKLQKLVNNLPNNITHVKFLNPCNYNLKLYYLPYNLQKLYICV